MKKKVIAILMILVMVLSCFTACKGSSDGDKKSGNKKNPNAKEIVISYWNTGLGREWLDEMIASFEEKYSDYYVTLVATAVGGGVTANFGLEDVDQTDLYMMTIVGRDTDKLEPLDDILEATADGDQIALKDKFDSGILTTSTSEDGHIYSLPYGGGVTGIVYNEALFKEAGIKQLPRTTDELATVCDALYNHDITPLCHYAGNGYYWYLDSVLRMQYDGYEYTMNNFYACTDEKGVSPSKEVFTKKDGRYYALKALEKILLPEYTLTGSNSKSHTEIQTEFASGKAAMMVNGSWIKNEIAAMGTDNIRMMTNPVISSIVDKLSTVKSDYLLRELITAIDQVKSGEKKLSDFASGEDYMVGGSVVSADDWNRVMEARYTVLANFHEHGTYIPNYSDNIEGAKKFVQFMNSDEGMKIYYDECKLPKPLTFSTGKKVNIDEYSKFEQQQFEIMSNAEVLISDKWQSMHKIFLSGASSYVDYDYAVAMTTMNSAQRKTADQIWNEVLKLIEDNYENNWLANMN